MRLFILLGALAPFAFACDNPDNDTCAFTMTASAASASPFCATYTTASSTATTDLPTWATACSNKPKKLSSACSCLNVATTFQISAKTTGTGIGGSGTVSKVPTYFNTTSVAQLMVSTSSSTPRATSTSTKASSKIAVSSAVSSAASFAAPAATSVASVAAATVAVGSAAASCTATEYAQITSVVAACTNIVLENISAPASSMIDLTGLQDGSSVTFAGETTFGYTEDSDFNPIEIAGTDITITGAEGAVIDGNGQAYWDGEGSNGGTDKPDHFIALDKMINGVIQNLYIQNWPTHCFDVTGCDGLTITGLTLNNSAGDAANSASDGKAAAHNSDGFDFSSSDNLFLSNTVVMNQDDCVAITSSTNLTITSITCSREHGLSIGSIGGKSNNDVSGVIFSDSTVSNSENGCRIKSNADTTGTIENIVYKNIVLSEISDYGIDIQQDYLNGGATGDPTNGVTISGVTFDNISGSATSDAYNYYILCGSDSCSDFTFADVSVTGGGEISSCNYPSTGCPS